MNTRNIFVLDTSALIALVEDIGFFREKQQFGFAEVMGKNEIIIPRVVIDDIDQFRNTSGERRNLFFEISRQLENYSNLGNLLDGVETKSGGILRIVKKVNRDFLKKLDNDLTLQNAQIIGTVIELKELFPEKKIKLITQDRLFRVIAKSIYSIDVEELNSVCVPEVNLDLGYSKIEVTNQDFDQIERSGIYNIPFVPYINQFFHIVDVNSNREIYAISVDVENSQAIVLPKDTIDNLKVSGVIQGKNIRQKLLLYSLMSNDFIFKDIKLITVSGPAGSGKSFLTLSAAWERLERGHFDKIVITRPMIDVGTSLGYLPGTLEEKLKPWGGLIEDNLRAIVSASYEDGKKNNKRSFTNLNFDPKTWLENENRLELVPLAYIRGRTFRRSFVILEEAQNLARGPLKVLLTRLGEGSIIVIIGDETQIDNPFLSKKNNALVHSINAFSSWKNSLHFNLKSIVRSEIAEMASKLL